MAKPNRIRGSSSEEEGKLTHPSEDSIEALRRRLGRLDRRQIAVWQRMTSAQRAEIAFQAYQFAVETVRFTERRRHPELSPEDLAWRLIRRMHGPKIARLLQSLLKQNR